jgi:hypothetical protein
MTPHPPDPFPQGLGACTKTLRGLPAGTSLLGDAVQVAVMLRPGDLLVFDNLRLAHGRSGTRQPGELRQRVFGYRNLSAAGQLELRDRVLGAFDAPNDCGVQLSAP